MISAFNKEAIALAFISLLAGFAAMFFNVRISPIHDFFNNLIQSPLNSTTRNRTATLPIT
jgi:hypothetical protein